MGKNQTIPYLNEVLLYFGKAAVIFLAFAFFLSRSGLYNAQLLLILAMFMAFSFHPTYLLLITLNYFVILPFTFFGISDFGFLFISLLAVLINTFLTILTINLYFHFTEEK